MVNISKLKTQNSKLLSIAKKGKIFVIFTAIVLAGGIFLIGSGQSAAENPKIPLSAPAPVAGAFYDPPTGGGANSQSFYTGNNNGGGEFFLKMMLSLLLVVVLGAIAMYCSKKLLPRISNSSGKDIRIVETVHLGPRKAVHLIRIGSQQLLIGSTSESITMLADVTYGLTQDAVSFADLQTEHVENRVRT